MVNAYAVNQVLNEEPWFTLLHCSAPGHSQRVRTRARWRDDLGGCLPLKLSIAEAKGSYLVVLNVANDLIVWNTENYAREYHLSLGGGRDPVVDIAVCPMGTWKSEHLCVAVARWSGVVNIVNVTSGENVHQLSKTFFRSPRLLAQPGAGNRASLYVVENEQFSLEVDASWGTPIASEAAVLENAKSLHRRREGGNTHNEPQPRVNFAQTAIRAGMMLITRNEYWADPAWLKVWIDTIMKTR